MIDQLRVEYPVRWLCEVLGVPPSSYYYVAPVADEQSLITVLEEMLMRWPFYGYRRLVAQLRRQGFAVGERVVRRLLRQLQTSRSVSRLRIITTDSAHAQRRYPNLIRHLTLVHPDQVWVGDITYIRLGTHFIYLAVVLDGYTRSVRGWAVSLQVDQTLTLTALRRALSQGTPHFFHSDQGVQYAAYAHTELLRQHQVQISMSDLGQPTQNALAERFMRTLKEEHVNYTEYTDIDDAQRQLQQWLEVEYMTQRIHSALDYLTPFEFEGVAAAQSNPPL
jgi:transposase InsO family protein